MKRVTIDDVIKINQAYLKHKTYAGAARETGFSPTTIKKYIIPDFGEEKNPLVWNKKLPEPGTFFITNKDFTPEELQEIEEMRKDFLL